MLQKLKPIMAEPLLHFLGAGLLIFLVLGGSDAVNREGRAVTVTQTQINQLSESFTGTWRRPPTPEELDQLIRNFVREEIYYREALKLGLDENDTVIRRRLRAKMEALATAEAQSAQPSEADLQELLDDNPAKYAADASFSFEQIWLGTDGDADAALASIQSGTAPRELGKPISLPEEMTEAHSFDIDRRFGKGFAAKLAAATVGQWMGPVTSGFGVHLVKVTKAEAARKPALADVRKRLETDWRLANITEREEEAYKMLLDNYDVDIAKPE